MWGVVKGFQIACNLAGQLGDLTGNKFIIFVVYLWFVVAYENSLLWGTLFNGVSNVRCEDVEHNFGIVIATQTSPVYS